MAHSARPPASAYWDYQLIQHDIYPRATFGEEPWASKLHVTPGVLVPMFRREDIHRHKEPSMVTLTTPRLTLRMFRDDDLPAYAAICADPEVMRYLGDGRPLSRVGTWRQMAMILGHWTLRGYGLWAVEERATQTLVGRIGCFNPEGWPGFELGWMLGRPYWGLGYATEGARAALEYAFTTLQQEHVISLIRPENAASIRVATRLGEQLEGQMELLGGPALVYGIRRKT